MAKTEKPAKTKVPKTDDFGYHTPDVHGLTVDSPEMMSLMDNRMVHSGNGKTYQIVGFVWMGATDEWGYAHSAVTEDGSLVAPTIVRPLAHLTGKRDNGELRYKVVK